MGDAESKTDEAKGRVKEAAGDLTGNEELEREGKVDQGKAGLKEKVAGAADTAREKIDEAADTVTDALRKD
jgi:uncharacterized protein YjbJ (UPF0337 family)